MGCVCCSLSSFVSILLDALERISLCTVCAMLTCCLLLTILTMMILGIGIGYHYCFVQSSVEAMEKAAQASRSGGEAVRTIDRAMKKSINAHRVQRRDVEVLTSYYNKNTQVINNTLGHSPLGYPTNETSLNGTDTSFKNIYYPLLNTTNLTAAIL